MIKYSIIIPHHNDLMNLKRLLRTIPDVRTVEIIVIDDHSNEEVLSALMSLERQNLKILNNDSTIRSAGKARNIGLKIAAGKWIVFADSDDIFVNGFIEILDKYFLTTDDVVYFLPKASDNFGNLLGEDDYRCYYERMFKKYLDDKTIENLWNIRLLFGAPWSKMINNSFLRKHEIQFDEVKKHNDTNFSTKVGLYGNCYVASCIIYNVIDRKGSISYTNENFQFESDFFVYSNQIQLIQKEIVDKDTFVSLPFSVKVMPLALLRIYFNESHSFVNTIKKLVYLKKMKIKLGVRYIPHGIKRIISRKFLGVNNRI